MRGQMKLWGGGWTDLLAKLKSEKDKDAPWQHEGWSGITLTKGQYA